MSAGSPEFVIPDIPSPAKTKAFTVRLGVKDAEQIYKGLRVARSARPDLGVGEFLGELAIKHLLDPDGPELDDLIRERLLRSDEISRQQLECFERLVTGTLAAMSDLCERVEAVENRQAELMLSLPLLFANEAKEMTKAARRLGDAALMFGAAYK